MRVTEGCQCVTVDTSVDYMGDDIVDVVSDMEDFNE